MLKASLYKKHDRVKCSQSFSLLNIPFLAVIVSNDFLHINIFSVLRFSRPSFLSFLGTTFLITFWGYVKFTEGKFGEIFDFPFIRC